MNFLPRNRLNSREFNFIMTKLESFEKSTMEMSKNLEGILDKLTDVVVRQDEKIKGLEKHEVEANQAFESVRKEASIIRLLLASIAGGLAVVTFFAAEAGVVKLILSMQDPPAEMGPRPK